MKLGRGVLIRLLVLGSVGGTHARGVDLVAALDRYESAQAQSLIEDLWAHQRRVVSTRFARSEPHLINEDPLVRVEWYLRVGPARAPITLADLKRIKDARLLDEILWALLNEAVSGDVFLATNDWIGIRAALNTFLSEHALRGAVVREAHGAWWAWIQGVSSKTAPSAWQLEALIKTQEARMIADPLRSLQSSCAASEALPGDARATGLSLARQTRGRFPDDIRKQRQLLREVYLAKTPCRRLFDDLADVYEERSEFALASEQRSYALLQKLESGETLESSDIRDIARYSFEGGDWSKAHEFYTRAIAGGARDLDLRVRELVTAQRAGHLKNLEPNTLRWRFENLLKEAFNSIYRDELLLSYASYLDDGQNLQDVRDVWQWNFQYASRRDQRVQGLERLVQIEGQELEGGPVGLARKGDALRWLDYLSVLQRFATEGPVFDHEVGLAPGRLQRLELLGEAEVRASLGELQSRGPR
jgi:hypothetical protein